MTFPAHLHTIFIHIIDIAVLYFDIQSAGEVVLTHRRTEFERPSVEGHLTAQPNCYSYLKSSIESFLCSG